MLVCAVTFRCHSCKAEIDLLPLSGSSLEASRRELGVLAQHMYRENVDTVLRNISLRSPSSNLCEGPYALAICTWMLFLHIESIGSHADVCHCCRLSLKERVMADSSTRGRVKNELNTAKFSWFHIKAILVSGVG